jgi:hypothetical protein
MFIEWIWSHNKPYKNFEGNIIQFLGLQRKRLFIVHLIEFLYSLGLNFVAWSVGDMCNK